MMGRDGVWGAEGSSREVGGNPLPYIIFGMGELHRYDDPLGLTMAGLRGCCWPELVCFALKLIMPI